MYGVHQAAPLADLIDHHVSHQRGRHFPMLVSAHAIGDQEQAKGCVGVIGVFIARAAQTDVRAVSEFDHGLSVGASR